MTFFSCMLALVVAVGVFCFLFSKKFTLPIINVCPPPPPDPLLSSCPWGRSSCLQVLHSGWPFSPAFLMRSPSPPGWDCHDNHSPLFEALLSGAAERWRRARLKRLQGDGQLPLSHILYVEILCFSRLNCNCPQSHPTPVGSAWLSCNSGRYPYFPWNERARLKCFESPHAKILAAGKRVPSSSSSIPFSNDMWVGSHQPSLPLVANCQMFLLMPYLWNQCSLHITDPQQHHRQLSELILGLL